MQPLFRKLFAKLLPATRPQPTSPAASLDANQPPVTESPAPAPPLHAPRPHPSVAPALKPDQQQIEALIAQTAPKLRGWPVAWLEPSSLPQLQFLDGKPLSEDAVRYLLHRQAREKEMVAEGEAALLYALIDRKTSGDFALAILNAYLSSSLDAKDRWVMVVAALLGDDRLVPLLTSRIGQWAEASRGKLAEYAVHALALLGSDAALLAIDALAIRYRTRFKNIGKAAAQAFAAAADARGLSPAELGDRVVPWLGFQPGKPRLFAFGSYQLEARIGSDFKLTWYDLAKGKAVKSLPASAPDEVKAEAKELAAGLKEAAKAQLLRMENLMVQQHRWPSSRWAELFLPHPVLFPFAARLVWGVFEVRGTLGATLRALEDHSLTNSHDEPVPVPADAFVGIVHPLQLDPELRLAWVKHLVDYSITPPFDQLARPVILVPPRERSLKMGDALAGTKLNAMTFKGRAERLGWSRGSVCDAGSVPFYHKTFPGAGIDAFIGTDGMFVGIDRYSDIKLGKVLFVRHGSVQVGSYTYDEPRGAHDPRLLAFGEVPPIVFSEVMGDLQKIAGSGTTGD